MNYRFYISIFQRQYLSKEREDPEEILRIFDFPPCLVASLLLSSHVPLETLPSQGLLFERIPRDGEIILHAMVYTLWFA